MDKVPELVKQPEPLATELLKEVKASRKCWVAVAIIELIIILVITGLFIWYITMPAEEYVIDQDSNENSYNQVIGGDFNGGTSADYLQAEGSAS